MKFFFSILCCLATMSLSAQIQLKAFFEQDTVMIGDTVGLHYQILLTAGTEISAVDLAPLDSVFTSEQMQAAASDTSINWEEVFNAKSQFEILNYGTWTPSETNGLIPATGLRWRETTGAQNGQRILSNRLTAVFWDEGTFIIPNPKIAYRAGNQTRLFEQPGAANQVLVQVPTVVDVSAVDTLTQLTPIKPILEVRQTWTDLLWLLIFCVVLIAPAFVYYFLRKKNTVQELNLPDIKQPAHIVALNKLRELKEERLWEKDEIKEYHFQLTLALREYLENRYDIQALESTTPEILQQLNHSDFTESRKKKIQELLQVADLVKFAKAKPPLEFHARVLEDSIEFVEKTKVEIKEEDTEIIPTPIKRKPLARMRLRVWAAFVNALVILSIFTVCGLFTILLVEDLQWINNEVIIILPFCVLVAYYQFVLVNQGQKSLGKFLMKISVKNNDESIPNLGKALLRAYAKIRSGLMIFSVIGSIITGDNRLGHDIATDTNVIDVNH